MAAANASSTDSDLDAVGEEIDDICWDLYFRLEHVLSDISLKSVDSDLGGGETWCALVNLAVCATAEGKPVDSEVVPLIQRALDLTRRWDLDESLEDDVDGLESALVELKERRRKQEEAGPLTRCFGLTIDGTKRDEVIDCLRKLPGVTRVYHVVTRVYWSFPPTETVTVFFGDSAIDVWLTDLLTGVATAFWAEPGGITPMRMFNLLHAALPHRMEMWEDGVKGLVATTDPPTAV
jgi:hypothetical protein